MMVQIPNDYHDVMTVELDGLAYDIYYDIDRDYNSIQYLHVVELIDDGVVEVVTDENLCERVEAQALADIESSLEHYEDEDLLHDVEEF